jgi:hypothetical protein
LFGTKKLRKKYMRNQGKNYFAKKNRAQNSRNFGIQTSSLSLQCDRYVSAEWLRSTQVLTISAIIGTSLPARFFKSLLFHLYPQRCTILRHCSLARRQVDSEDQLQPLLSERFSPANTVPNDCVRAGGRNPLVDKKSGRTKREINLIPTLIPVKDGKQTTWVAWRLVGD